MGFSNFRLNVVARVLLQSPGFLYTTELGEPGAGPGFVMTSDEVATALGSPLGTVKSWVRRGLESLKGCLGP